MKRRPFFTLILFFLTFSLLSSGLSTVEVEASNGYLVRNLDTGLGYMSIQEAINAPETQNGHRIHVSAGRYYENVVVNKTVSLIGEDKETTIIDANKTSRDTLLINADGVSVSGFTLMHSYAEPGQGGGGLSLDAVGNVQISDIIACENYADWGVHLSPVCHDVNISRATVVNNSRSGLILNEAWKVRVYGSEILNNEWGIAVYLGENNSIVGNNITSNNDVGIRLEHHLMGLIQENIITNNHDGIFCRNSSDVLIRWNDVYGNKGSDVSNEDSSVTVNAIYNYWGDDFGKFSGNILYSPWLTESALPFALVIESPVSGMTVGLTLTVKTQVSDLTNILRVEFYLHDVLVHTAYEMPFQWTWDTTRHANGEYTVVARAYDNIGNMKTSETRVTVKNVESPWWQTHFFTIVQVLVAICGLILGIFTYSTSIRKRKKKQKEE